MSDELSAQEIFDKLFNEFIAGVKVDITRKEFINWYLGTFLGRPPKFLYKKLIVDDNDVIKAAWIDQIENNSLWLPEEEFIRNILEVHDDKNYLDEYINIYNNTEQLKDCELGELMLKCLIESKKITH